MSYELLPPSDSQAADMPTSHNTVSERSSSSAPTLDPRLTELASTAVDERASLTLSSDTEPAQTAPSLHEIPRPADVQLPSTPTATSLESTDTFSLQSTPVAPPVAPREAAKPTPLSPDSGSSLIPSSYQLTDSLSTPALRTDDSEYWLSPQSTVDSRAAELATIPATVDAQPSLTARSAPERLQTDNQQSDEPIAVPDRPSLDPKPEVTVPSSSRDDEPVDKPVLQTGGAGHGNGASYLDRLRSDDGESGDKDPDAAIRRAYEQRIEELKAQEIAEGMREVGNCLSVIGEIAYGPHGNDLKLEEDWFLNGLVDEYVNDHNSSHVSDQIAIDKNMVVGRWTSIPFEVNGQSARIEIVVYDENLGPLLRNVDNSLNTSSKQAWKEKYHKDPGEYAFHYTSLGDFRLTVENSEIESSNQPEDGPEPATEAPAARGWIHRDG
jgi:hypothetical protein